MIGFLKQIYLFGRAVLTLVVALLLALRRCKICIAVAVIVGIVLATVYYFLFPPLPLWNGALMVNVSLSVAAVIAVAAISLHVYTFEVLIWPNLRDESFPSFPFGPGRVVKGFYRTVWHFLTVNFLLTIVVLIAIAFGNLAPYGMLFVWFLIGFWILIVVEIFFVAALSLQPGDSYIRTMVREFLWPVIIIVVMVLFMYNGARG